MVHPLVTQLRFARSEFVRCLEGVSDEQYYFVFFHQGKVPHPELNKLVGFGHPATTPPLADMWQVWRDITAEADQFLDTLTTEHLGVHLEQRVEKDVKEFRDALFGTASEEALARIWAEKSVRNGENNGTRLLRVTYHYFFHTGEAHAVRQQLGHPDLPFFVGSMPDKLFNEGGGKKAEV